MVSLTDKELQEFLKRYKYKDISGMSILHLSMLGRRLGINVDKMREESMSALQEALYQAIQKAREVE